MKLLDLPALDKINPSEEWSPWKPTDRDPFNAKWAAHLYRRAGFGCTPDELKNAVTDGLDKTFEKMLAPAKTPLKPLPPVRAPAIDPNNPVPQPVFAAGAIQIRANWLNRMLSGQEPILERLTLFWHNHFATSIAKIQDGTLMERQNSLIKKHALGKFGPFLKEMSRDAAMLIWLDSNQNVKAHPNENYAREIMELFSLGVGNYKEKDVQEAARAFTGWHVSSGDGSERHFAFRSAEHDYGKKTILGQTGEWDGDDVIRILMEQKACSRFLVTKLYNFLCNENVAPPEKFIQPLCDELAKSDYDLGALVKRMLKSKHFFSAHSFKQRVKSPIDYVLGVARMFGTGSTGSVVVSPYSLMGTLELQGQQLYQPPNVKGWEGGKAWLNTATVLARHNFAYEMCNGMSQLNREATRITGATFVPYADPLALHRQAKIDDAPKIVQFYGNLLLPGDLKPEVAGKLTRFVEKDDPEEFVFKQRCRDIMVALLTLPNYQLC
jgi:uncharacterized protein (DUF1800 family)